MIHGVAVRPLRKIPDERGAVYHMLRADAPHFEKFGEIYFSKGYPGAVKGWHLHRRMTLNYAVVLGMAKIVVYDPRPDSPTRGEVQEIFAGEDQYCLVTVPPLTWNGWKCVGSGPALVANCATEPHDPQEIERLDPFDPSIPYDWSLKHG